MYLVLQAQTATRFMVCPHKPRFGEILHHELELLVEAGFFSFAGVGIGDEAAGAGFQDDT